METQNTTMLVFTDSGIAFNAHNDELGQEYIPIFLNVIFPEWCQEHSQVVSMFLGYSGESGTVWPMKGVKDSTL